MSVLTPQQALIEHYLYKGWNRCDASVLRQVLDETVVFRGAFCKRRPAKGIDAVISYMQSAHAALERYTVEIDDIIVTGNRAAVHGTARGWHKGTFFGMPGSGVEVQFSTATFFTLSEDHTKIVEMWVLGDLDSLKKQINASSRTLPAFPEQENQSP